MNYIISSPPPPQVKFVPRALYMCIQKVEKTFNMYFNITILCKNYNLIKVTLLFTCILSNQIVLKFAILF